MLSMIFMLGFVHVLLFLLMLFFASYCRGLKLQSLSFLFREVPIRLASALFSSKSLRVLRERICLLRNPLLLWLPASLVRPQGFDAVVVMHC